MSVAIINDILDLSKVEAGKMELVYTDYHLKTVVGEVVGMMDMAASKRGLIMKYECDSSLPCRYSGDEGRIKQQAGALHAPVALGVHLAEVLEDLRQVLLPDATASRPRRSSAGTAARTGAPPL